MAISAYGLTFLNTDKHQPYGCSHKERYVA